LCKNFDALSRRAFFVDYLILNENSAAKLSQQRAERLTLALFHYFFAKLYAIMEAPQKFRMEKHAPELFVGEYYRQQKCHSYCFHGNCKIIAGRVDIYGNFWCLVSTI